MYETSKPRTLRHKNPEIHDSRNGHLWVRLTADLISDFDAHRHLLEKKLSLRGESNPNTIEAYETCRHPGTQRFYL